MNDHYIVTIVLLVQLERVLNMTTCTCHVYTYTTRCNELCRVFNMIGNRYNQIDY